MAEYLNIPSTLNWLAVARVAIRGGQLVTKKKFGDSTSKVE